MEEEIFRKTEFQDTALRKYGFKKKNDSYIYTKNILEDAFQVQIMVTKGVLKGKIYDLASMDEYINFRLNKQGEFSHKVRKIYEEILLDIKKKCTKETKFLSPQTKRIVALIFQKYQTKPEFIFEKYPDYGVFKNNNKWYGIIMSVKKNKILDTKDDTEIEILNVKLKKEEIASLIKEKGFLKAYHMNKENWLTIMLDDSLSDDTILHFIDESYQYTKVK